MLIPGVKVTPVDSAWGIQAFIILASAPVPLVPTGGCMYRVSESFSDRLLSQQAVFVLCSSAFLRPTCTFCREVAVPLLGQVVHMPEKGAVFDPPAVALVSGVMDVHSQAQLTHCFALVLCEVDARPCCDI